MQLKLLLPLVAACAISLGSISTAQAASCTLYFSNSTLATVPSASTVVVVGPYTTSCTGSHTGSVNNLSNAYLVGWIERNIGGLWTDVSGAGMSALSHPPGTYRYVVQNTLGGNGTFKLNYRHP